VSEVTARHVDAVPTVMVRREVPAAGLPAGIPAVIMPMFDEVYRGVPPGGFGGHNAVLYQADADTWTIEVGMTVPPGAEVPPGVRQSHLPAGEVAVLLHTGSYAEIPAAHAQIQEWIQEAGRQPAGVTWEIYGHPDEDDDERDVAVEIHHLLTPT
jgi:effector-binding domain-containing protein